MRQLIDTVFAPETFVSSRPLTASPLPRFAWTGVLATALAIVVLHFVTNGRYGFHRDELQFLSDARHPAWGYMPYPPFTSLVEGLLFRLFGPSLRGLRSLSVLAQGTLIVVSALMARELGGGKLAQSFAALTVALSPLPVFEGTEFQYTSFELLWWGLIALFTVRLLQRGDERYWLAIGFAAGLGVETKYTILFTIAGVLAGFAFTPARRYLRSRWFAAAVLLTFALGAPNLVWQARHGFLAIDFTNHIHGRDIRIGRGKHFFRDQLLICANLAAAPLWMAGLVACVRRRAWRPIAWLYIVPLLFFLLQEARGYYMGGAYPMLLAAGAVSFEAWLGAMRRQARLWLTGSYAVLVLMAGVFACAALLPLADSGPLYRFALKNSDDLHEEIGWDDLADEVAAVRDGLPPEQRLHLGILTGNYGEQGALELMGPKHGLPLPFGVTNTAWMRGYPSPPPTNLIVVGWDLQRAQQALTGCRVAAHVTNRRGVANEETISHPDILVCGPPRLPWPEFWRRSLNYG